MNITSKKTAKYAVSLLCLGVVGYLAATSFVAKKSKNDQPKLLSASAAKDHLIDDLGVMLEQSAKLSKQVARVQKRAVKRVRELAEGNKNGVFAPMSKEELNHALLVVQRTHVELNALARRIKQVCFVLQPEQEIAGSAPEKSA